MVADCWLLKCGRDCRINGFGKWLTAWGFYLRHADNVRLENSVFTLVGEDVRPPSGQGEFEF